MSDEMKNVDDLAQFIRQINGWRAKGAGSLAEELWPAYSALQQQLAAAREALQAAEANDSRYRRLRGPYESYEPYVRIDRMTGVIGFEILTGANLDAAIDATLQRDRQP